LNVVLKYDADRERVRSRAGDVLSAAR